MDLTPDDLTAIDQLPPGLRAELDELLKPPIWRPHPKNEPQCLAFDLADKVDVLGFGGAAGGGKTDLGCGLALLKHSVCQVFRREGTEMRSIIDRFEQIVGHRERLGGVPPKWRAPYGGCKMIEFGSTPHLGDEKKYQGRAKDLLWFDEAANFLEAQVEFLMGWVRPAEFDEDGRSDQHLLVLMTFNPPTSSDGLWIIDYFGPWLNHLHPNPAESGEIRYMTKVNGTTIELETKDPFVLADDKTRVYDFDPSDYKPEEIYRPQSRSFVKSKVSDNPYLIGSPYIGRLMQLPEPLQSLMLHGDFRAAMKDDAMQLIPTAWIDAAMDRWKKPEKMPPMDCVGVDVAMRGDDDTAIARRHGSWFDELIYHPGIECQDGPQVAGYVIQRIRDGAPVALDTLGVGAEPYAHLRGLSIQAHGVNMGDPAEGVTSDGKYPFKNIRSMLWWRMREALDPVAAEKTGIALPPDKRLRSELAAPKFAVPGRVIQVESRDSIVKRTGKSPDGATAVIMAQMEIPKWANLNERIVGGVNPGDSGDFDPYDDL